MLRHVLFILFVLLLLKIGLLSAQSAKERIYALCLKGLSQAELSRYGSAFAQRLLEPTSRLLRTGALDLIKAHQGAQCRVAVVSASPEIYLRPFCEALGIDCIASRFEFDAAGCFTGRLQGANCNGSEKVHRVKEHFGDLSALTVEVYGDSPGDYPLLNLADSNHAHLNVLREHEFSFKLRELLRLMRVQQYVKNTFVFIPLFFGGKFFDPVALFATIQAALAFSLTSSFIYVLNDLKDVNEDRQHSLKRFRPLAAKTVTPLTALLLGSISLGLGLLLAGLLNPICLALIVGYLALNLLYVYFIKKWALFDLICIAIGFDLRVFTGAAACSVFISSWLILMVFLLAMFLAMGKRWDDLGRQERRLQQAHVEGKAPVLEQASVARLLRPSLYGYSRDFALSTLTFLSAVNTICYIQYSMDESSIVRLGSPYLFLTSLWVILGNLRYLQDIFVLNQGYSPTKVLLKDRALLSCLGLWALHVTAIIYFNGGSVTN